MDRKSRFREKCGGMHRHRLIRFSAFLIALLLAGPWPLARGYEIYNLQSQMVPIKHCSLMLSPATRAAQTRLQDEEEILVLSWNVENLMANQTKDWKFQAKQKKILDAWKYAGLKKQQLPHFIIAPEIMNIEAADQLFNSGVLGDNYNVYLVAGNDGRHFKHEGRDVAIAIRGDLDVSVEFETHRDALWKDPAANYATKRLFSRDKPFLIIRDGKTGEVLKILGGEHGKSLRNRADGKDFESKMIASAQAQAGKKIIHNYQKRFGRNVKMVIGGDWNRNIQTSEELQPIRDVLKDAFDLVDIPNRTTQIYFPHHGYPIATPMDALMVSPSIAPFITNALVLPEIHHITGKPIPTPRSLEERDSTMPSDHHAIAIVYNGKKAFSDLAEEEDVQRIRARAQ